MAKLQLRDFNNLFVGAMLMATVAVLATAGIATLRHMDVFREDYTLHVIFARNIGINVGTKVKINGVEIGKVSAVELTDNGAAVLSLLIARKFAPHITSTSVAYPTRDQNIISDRIIMITHGATGSPLENDDYVRADEAQDIETLVANANALFGRLTVMLDAVDTVLARVTDTSRTLGAIIGKDEIYRDVKRQMARLDHITGSASKMVDELDAKVVKPAADRADTLLGSAAEIAAKGSEAMAEAAKLIERANATFEAVNGMMARANALMAAGEEKLDQADDLITGVSKMWLIRGGIPDRTKGFDMTEESW